MALTPEEELELINIIDLENQSQEPGVFDSAIKSLQEPVAEAKAAPDLTGFGLSGILQKVFTNPLIEATTNTRGRIAGRLGEVQDTVSDLRRGAVDPIQAGTQIVGQGGFGSFLDVAGESLAAPVRAGFRELPEQAQESIRAGGSALLKTQPVQAGIGLLQQAAGKFSEFEKERPQAAKTAKALGNIALSAFPIASKTLLKKAKKLETKAQKQITDRREKFVDELVRPEQSKKVLIEQAKRTNEEGFLKTKIVSLSKREKEMAIEASKIKTMTRKRSLQFNRNEISNKISKINKELETDLRKSSVVLAKDKVKKAINNSIKKLVDENPFIKSETATRNMAHNVQRNAERILAKHQNTPFGVLKARKEFDNWALKLNKRAFDSSTATAFKDSLLTIRKTMNKIINDNVPSATVKQRLKSQNLLLDVMDNIDPKIASEQGKNAITRLFNKVTKIGPARNRAVATLGTVAGVGIIGGSQLFSGPIAAALGTAGILYAGHRAIMGPVTKKALAKLLRGADKIILTSKNPSAIRQLRADRAVLADLLKNSINEESNGN